jgi:alanyl-tRNA synthetase
MLDAVSEIDIALNDPSDARITDAVELANRVIWEDRPIRVRQVSQEDATVLSLRKEPLREGELRLIEIEGFDLTPCGGTHADRTGEVGLLAVRSWERAKGLTRVEFVAGRRALEDYNRSNRTARDVASLFSVGRDDAAASVARLVEENKQLSRRVRALEEITARVEAEDLVTETARNADGVRVIATILEDRDAESLRRLASALVTHAKTIALLGSREGEEARVVFARSNDTSVDMNALMREACAMLDGRGGGRADMAQGGGHNGANLESAIDGATRKLHDL